MSKKEQDRRAREADLIVLPKGTTGTNCGNCMYMNKETGQCIHRAVMQKVKSNWCCAYWDAKGVKRVGGSTLLE